MKGGSNMKLDAFKTMLFEKAQAAGFTDWELYYSESQGFEVSMFEREMDNYQVTGSIGVCFRGLYNGRMGYASAEILDEASTDMLVKAALENAKTLESPDVPEIYDGHGEYAQLPLYNEALQTWQAADKITQAEKMEALLYQHPYIQSDQTEVSTSRGTRRIMNSKGLDVSYQSNSCFMFVEAIVEKNGKKNNAYDYEGYRDHTRADLAKLARNAAEEALAFVDAQPVPSGKYPVILSNAVASSMLGTFSSTFMADEVQKGRSLLAGKLGQTIAAPHVTLLDDPHSQIGLDSRPFDAEGVPTYTKPVIDQGVLKTFLHNLTTARKDNVQPTGNAAKNSIASPVAISGMNLHFAAGELSLEELMQQVGNGLYITSVQGLHSGANAVSGDFSLGAKGFKVTDGKKAEAVEQITIAGNFFTLLQDIVALADDLRFRGYGSPALWVKELSVAGT